MTNQLRFRNQRQVILWNEEIAGQISDGQWENSGPKDHWIPWHDCQVSVDPVTPGRTFYAAKDSYLLTSKDLLYIVGDRMLGYVQKEFPGYTHDEMLADLRDMRKIMKTVVPDHTAGECSGGGEAHESHLAVNGECPWEAKPTPAMKAGGVPASSPATETLKDDEVVTITPDAQKAVGWNTADDPGADLKAWIAELENDASHPCSCQFTPHGEHSVLPTGTRIDLTDPSAAEYYDSAQTAFYLVPDEGAKAPCVVTTFSALDSNWKVGTSHSLSHDQSGKFWGTYHVAGVIRFADRANGGQIPAGKIRHLVFK